MPLSSVVGAQSIVKPGVCTSTTRPASPYAGQCIYETDTLLAKVWDGSTWADYPQGKANTASPTFTGTVTLPSTTSIGTVSATEIGYVDGVTSPIQTQLDSKLTATTAITSNRNKVINGDFKVWQRGTSVTVTSGAGYTTDRWNAWTISAGGSITVSQQTTDDATNLPNTKHCARFQRVAGNTSTSGLIFGQPLETVNSIQFAGKTVVFSFWARKGANYSSSGNALTAELWSNTTTNVALSSMIAGKTNVAATSVMLTGSWQKFTCTGTVATSATQIAPIFFFAGVGTAGAADYFEVTNIQVEEGAVATPFEFEDYGITLAKCKRYYQRVSFGVNTYTGYYSGNGSIFGIPLTLPVEMRTAPAISYVSTLGGAFYWVEPGIAAYSADSTAGLSLSGTTTSFMIQQARQAGGAAMVARTSYVLEASALFAASAEL